MRVQVEVIQEFIPNKEIDPATFNMNDPPGFLDHEGGAVSVSDMAYRSSLYEPGLNVILAGTLNAAHLAENLESFNRPPLPEEDTKKLRHLFRNVYSATAQ